MMIPSLQLYNIFLRRAGVQLPYKPIKSDGGMVIWVILPELPTGQHVSHIHDMLSLSRSREQDSEVYLVTWDSHIPV